MINIQQRGSRFQLRVTHRNLPKPFFWTFSDKGEAEVYGRTLDAQLDRGVVPVDLLEGAGRKPPSPSFSAVLTNYAKQAPVAPSDLEVIRVLLGEVGTVKVRDATYSWVEAYVRDLKRPVAGGRTRGLTPGTIRKRVGLLARVLDWHHRKETGASGLNPFRLLPKGYSSYTETDAAGGEARVDVQRDRRLHAGEVERVIEALDGVKRPDRERALTPDPAFRLLLLLILNTGLRLSEAYRLRVDQVDLVKWVLRVEGSKGARGAMRARVVPLVRALRKPLGDWCVGRVGLMFPFWDGTPEGRRKTTSKLSVRFGNLFDYAQVLDFTEHDLRHEATCRWVEMKDSTGRWLFSEVEICKLMGWTDPKLMLRYASLRGEDLSDRLA